MLLFHHGLNWLKLHSPNIPLTAGFIRFIRSVSTVVLGITHVARWQAAPVGTMELSRLAGPLGTSLWVLVAAIGTVIYSIAVPGHRDALLVFTLELVFLASVVTYTDRLQLDLCLKTEHLNWPEFLTSKCSIPQKIRPDQKQSLKILQV